VGDHVTATLAGVRPRTEKNHTATHIANWALREVLGEGVQQKGSLVDPDKLRFDFSHPKAMSEDEIARVETLVNECIARKLPAYAQVVDQKRAMEINGLRAVFGEKYPPVVRVVSIGKQLREILMNPRDPKWRDYSIEFCGGTHLKNTEEVEGFVITSEESVSKGIRRIVALTGHAAVESRNSGKDLLAKIALLRSGPPGNLPGIIKMIQETLGDETLPLQGKRC